MELTDKFLNGVPKIGVVWIISMFLIQVATILTMYLMHSKKIFFSHFSPEQKLYESVWWITTLTITSFIESMILVAGAIVIAVKSRKWSH